MLHCSAETLNQLTPEFSENLRAGRVLPAKTPIYHQGDNFKFIYRVNSGFVMQYRLLKDSRRQITGFCTPGDFFGMSPDDRYHDSAITVSTSNIVEFSRSDVETEPDLAKDLYIGTCFQLEEAQNMLVTLSKKKSGEKVAAFLWMLAQRETRLRGNSVEQQFVVDLPISRSDMADYLGLTIETISRRLTDLKHAEIISLPNRHSIQICDLNRLVRRAGAMQ